MYNITAEMCKSFFTIGHFSVEKRENFHSSSKSFAIIFQSSSYYGTQHVYFLWIWIGIIGTSKELTKFHHRRIPQKCPSSSFGRPTSKADQVLEKLQKRIDHISVLFLIKEVQHHTNLPNPMIIHSTILCVCKWRSSNFRPLICFIFAIQGNTSPDKLIFIYLWKFNRILNEISLKLLEH